MDEIFSTFFCVSLNFLQWKMSFVSAEFDFAQKSCMKSIEEHCPCLMTQVWQDFICSQKQMWSQDAWLMTVPVFQRESHVIWTKFSRRLNNMQNMHVDTWTWIKVRNVRHVEVILKWRLRTSLHVVSWGCRAAQLWPPAWCGRLWGWQCCGHFEARTKADRAETYAMYVVRTKRESQSEPLQESEIMSLGCVNLRDSIQWTDSIDIQAGWRAFSVVRFDRARATVWFSGSKTPWLLWRMTPPLGTTRWPSHLQPHGWTLAPDDGSGLRQLTFHDISTTCTR